MPKEAAAEPSIDEKVQPAEGQSSIGDESDSGSETPADGDSGESLESISNDIFKQVHSKVGDDDSATDGDGDPNDEQDSDDAAESEDQGTEEEDNSGTDLVIAEEDLDSYVKLPDGERLQVRDLVSGFRTKAQRDMWLQKTQALAQTKKQYDTALQYLGKVGELVNIPHRHIGHVVASAVKAGLAPAQMYKDIEAVFQRYVKSGEYDAIGIEQRESERVKNAEIAKRERSIQDREATLEMKDEVQKLTAKYGPIDEKTGNMIADYAEDHAAKTKQWLTPLEAFEALVKIGKIKPRKFAQPSKIRRADRLRRFGSPIKPVKSTSTTKDVESEVADIWRGIQSRKQIK